MGIDISKNCAKMKFRFSYKKALKAYKDVYFLAEREGHRL